MNISKTVELDASTDVVVLMTEFPHALHLAATASLSLASVCAAVIAADELRRPQNVKERM